MSLLKKSLVAGRYVAFIALLCLLSLGQAFGIIAQAVMDLEDSHTFFYPRRAPPALSTSG